MAKRQDRKFLGVLYPDSESYVCDDLLKNMDKLFPEFAYILHDMDVDDNGELKKPHIHWVGRFKSARSLQTVSDDIGVGSNMVEYCGDFKKAVQYLIHANDPDKYQYASESVVSSFDLEKYFRPDLDEIQQARILKTRIIDGCCTSVREAIAQSLEDDTYSALRRGGSLWTSAIAENRVLNFVAHDERYLYPSDMKAAAVYDAFTGKPVFSAPVPSNGASKVRCDDSRMLGEDG